MDDARIAQKLAEEHKKLAGIVADLRAVAGEVPAQPRDAWLDSLRKCFFAFRAHMIRRFALEEVAGFMREVLERRPTLSRQVELLHQEHRDILALTEEIQEGLTAVAAEDASTIEDLCMRVSFLLSNVDHHTEHENLLVSYVFTQDIGGED